ncbi:hypothetical protein HII13_004414 [Brettanomyces bruxellensis]|nr:hypothetical protein HII13_004414 [Brettanomyces bruxellensis]
MSKVTNKIRTYGTQCNQTAMILEAIRQLHVNLTLSMGIWIGEDTFINDKQFDDMRDLLNKYPETMFDSIFVGNEVLYREDKSVDELASTASLRKLARQKVVISEIGWPYTGGEYESAIANYTEMQLFLNDWICEAQNNKIYSIYFEAFDEPWKEIFDDGSQRWETNWGFLTQRDK